MARIGRIDVEARVLSHARNYSPSLLRMRGFVDGRRQLMASSATTTTVSIATGVVLRRRVHGLGRVSELVLLFLHTNSLWRETVAVRKRAQKGARRSETIR